MDRTSFTQEFLFRASPTIVYRFLTTPDCLIRWFCDECKIIDDKYIFEWDGSEEQAELIAKKADERVRFKWLESEDDDSFFEIRIQVDALTKDVSLIVTDFADDEDEVEEAKQLWENQIDELKHTIGA